MSCSSRYRKAVTNSQTADAIEEESRDEFINTLGRLLYIRGVNMQRGQDIAKAMTHYEEAHDLYQQYWGDDHSMTVAMKNVIDSMNGPWGETQRAQADALNRAQQVAAKLKADQEASRRGSRSGSRSGPDKEPVTITLYSPAQILKLNRQELLEQLTLVTKADKDTNDPQLSTRLKEQARLLLIALQSISND